MEDIVQKISDMSLEVVPVSSSSEYEYWEDSVEEYVNPPLSKSSEAWCTPLDLQVQHNANNTSTLASQSWASEMSLYDKMSPRRSMEQIKTPKTPAAIPTPKEYKVINLMTINHVIENSRSNSMKIKTENDFCDTATAKKIREQKEEKDNGARRSFLWGLGNKSPLQISQSVDLVEGEPSEQSKNLPTSKYNWSSRGPAFDYKNLLVNYIPPHMDSTALRNLFSPYGTIVSSKVIVDHASGFSRGYGFVKFKSAQDGINAQEALHQFQIGRKTLKVSFSRRLQSGEKTTQNTNLYLSNLDPRIDEDDLERNFRTCGYVVQCKVLKNANGISRQIGFVRYDNAESAQRAINRFDGQRLEGTERPIKIRIAGTPRVPPRRDAFGVHTFRSLTSLNSPPLVHPTSSSCYVTGFHISLSEKVLRKVFEPIGGKKVKSIRVIRRQSSPYAFVNFFNTEDAAEAAYTFNNTNLGNYILTVRLQT
jgi:RNA recognition motif-containing protein